MSTLGHVSTKLGLRLLVPIEEHASVGVDRISSARIMRNAG